IRQEIANVFVGAAVRLAILILDDNPFIRTKQVLPLPVQFSGREAEARDSLDFRQDCVQSRFDAVLFYTGGQFRFILRSSDERTASGARSKERGARLLRDFGHATR